MQRPRNGRIHQGISGQRLGKHVPVAKRWLCRQWPLLHSVAVNTPLQQYKSCDFYVYGQCRDVISKGQGQLRVSRMEAGSNTSTVALRVVGGDEMGSLEYETVKCGRKSHGTRIREWLRWRGPAAILNDRPVLSSEWAPHINKPATVWQ
jgi:hypothetical protein